VVMVRTWIASTKYKVLHVAIDLACGLYTALFANRSWIGREDQLWALSLRLIRALLMFHELVVMHCTKKSDVEFGLSWSEWCGPGDWRATVRENVLLSRGHHGPDVPLAGYRKRNRFSRNGSRKFGTACVPASLRGGEKVSNI